jgi:hypothetical protein
MPCLIPVLPVIIRFTLVIFRHIFSHHDLFHLVAAFRAEDVIVLFDKIIVIVYPEHIVSL